MIGTINQQINSAHTFINPLSGHDGLLIRLANGDFVACERVCTHEGSAVFYDPDNHVLRCPAHGATFDPTHGFRHLSGPGQNPLETVPLGVKSDGTIITG